MMDYLKYFSMIMKINVYLNMYKKKIKIVQVFYIKKRMDMDNLDKNLLKQTQEMHFLL